MLAFETRGTSKLWCDSSRTNSRTQQLAGSRSPNQLCLWLDTEVVNMAADGNPVVHLETGSHPNGGEEGDRFEMQGVGERGMGYMEREIFLQVELYADEEDDSTEIKRKKRMARTALTSWKETSELCGHRILQRDSEMRSIMNEVYNLVSLYSVFEGVVLTAVATSSRLGCEHLWSPVGLSLFAYSVLVVVAFTKFREIRNLQFTNTIESRALCEIIIWVQRLKNLGYANFDFARECRDRPHRRLRVSFWRNALVFIVLLTIFTAGIVFSLVHILCWS